MDEFELIDRYFARHSADVPGVTLGIGDDGAVVEFGTESDQLVIASDTLNIGTHFPAEMPAHAIGHRCLAVNLSDLAAMGAEPLWCTLALSLPKAEPAWLEDFSAGFFALASRSGIALIGGDTTRGTLSITVTVHGRVPRDSYIARAGAQVGDRIYVTGTPGDAAAGLGLISDVSSSAAAEYLRRRFCYPEPRVSAGISLRGIANAMIDLSDGLHTDLGRLAQSSGVGVEADVDALPLSKHLLAHAGDKRAIQCALTGGDDYELCFTVPEQHAASVAEAGDEWGLPVTEIGRVVAASDVTWRKAGLAFEFDPVGFEHFLQAPGNE